MNLERILDMLHDGIVSRPRNSHDVKARFALVQLFLVQKELGGVNHPPLFSRFHGFQRIAELMIGARFHFHEHNHPAVKRNQIDFASPAAIVALDNRIAFLFQEPFRDSFALPAKRLL
jgi:hypothetical protein